MNVGECNCVINNRGGRGQNVPCKGRSVLFLRHGIPLS